MAILDILEFPDPRLRQVAKEVDTVDDEVRQLVSDMIDTMYESNGIGLAATQVIAHLRIVVIDVSEEREQAQVFINPRVDVLSDALHSYQEGGLSVPGFYENVERPERVQINALDIEGKPFSIETEGLLAVCIQHEIDHLEGKLFVDYLSALKRNRIRQKLLKERRQA